MHALATPRVTCFSFGEVRGRAIKEAAPTKRALSSHGNLPSERQWNAICLRSLPLAVLDQPNTTMKLVVCLLVVSVAVVRAADEKKAEDADRSKVFRRLIPADVLRDFPGVCFASTRCSTIEPGNTWDLAPFCGRSTCVKSDEKHEQLLEMVEDCGPLPKPNPKCKLSEKTNKTAPFPECCPIFECETGVKLEYPEIPAAPPAASTPAPKA